MGDAKAILDFVANSDDDFYVKEFDRVLSVLGVKKTDIPRLLKMALKDPKNTPDAMGAVRLMTRIPLADFRKEELMSLVPKEQLKKLPSVSSTWGPQVNSVEHEEFDAFGVPVEESKNISVDDVIAHLENNSDPDEPHETDNQAADITQYDEWELVSIPIEKLDFSPDNVSNRRSRELVKSYARLKTEAPPIIVIPSESEAGLYRIVDGYHRVGVAHGAGKSEVMAYVPVSAKNEVTMHDILKVKGDTASESVEESRSAVDPWGFPVSR